MDPRPPSELSTSGQPPVRKTSTKRSRRRRRRRRGSDDVTPAGYHGADQSSSAFAAAAARGFRFIVVRHYQRPSDGRRSPFSRHAIPDDDVPLYANPVDVRRHVAVTVTRTDSRGHKMRPTNRVERRESDRRTTTTLPLLLLLFSPVQSEYDVVCLTCLFLLIIDGWICSYGHHSFGYSVDR